MADISTAVSMARVPILGENGRISDDYIPAAIGENVTKAESAATRAETAATDAESAKEDAETAKTAAQSAKTAAETAREGAESAKTVAEAAKAAAEKAKADAESAGTAAASSATQAANSAQDAQQSATAAAESAASVADKFIASAQATTLEPGSQATASVENQVLTIGVPKGEKGDKGDQGEKGDTGTGVPEGGEPGQLLSKTDSGTAWVDPPSGNVLKGTLGPAPVLSADDAYATKPRRLTVYGETRQNLWVNPSGTKNGVTITSNGDGSMTLSGTATSAASVSSADSYIIKPSTAYTLSMNAALTGASFVVTEYDAAGSQLAQHNVSSTSAASFTSSASVARCVMSLSVQSGQAVSGTYRVMLNEGSTAQPWCPPGLNGVDELSIVTAGKNLAPTASVQDNEQISRGLSASVNADGSYRITGTSTAGYANPLREARVSLVRGTYTLSGRLKSLNEKGYMYAQIFIDGSYITAADGPETIEIEHDGVYFITFPAPTAGATFDGNLYVQLELGSTATAYEPPNITTTPIDLDGHTLNSLPDGTRDELRIDGTGAVTLVQRVGDVTVPSGTTLTAGDGDGNYYRLNATVTSKAGTVNYTNGYCDKMPVTHYPKGALGVIHSRNADMVSFYARQASYGNFNDANTAVKSVLPVRLLYPLATPQEIDLPGITLPTLPAPTVNVYADAEASGMGYAMGPDVGMEYERDVTIAFDKLQAQISATTVREATNG